MTKYLYTTKHIAVTYIQLQIIHWVLKYPDHDVCKSVINLSSVYCLLNPLSAT